VKRIGVDTGGTFTDAVLWDGVPGTISTAKASSNRDDLAQAVLASIAKFQLSELDRRDVRYLFHGTTVATNAVLEEAGPRVAVLCTEGFRDVLEIGRLGRSPAEIYDLRARPSLPPVMRRDRLEIPERIDHRGAIVRELDEAAVASAARVMRDRGIMSVAVCFLHSYVSSCHEERAREILLRENQDLAVSLSSEVLPEFREYERSCAAVLNAYLVPVVSRYITHLDELVASWSPNVHLWIMQSNGGVSSTKRAAAFPVTLLLSGPSGGVVATRYLMRQAGLNCGITMDMGGTSFDVCLLPDDELPVTHERRVLDMPVRVPSLDILTIGAGGGSIAWVDDGGQFRVGPRSAGATPGPACYGRGGTAATVTDANVVLGLLADGQLLGGEVELDAGRAYQACEQLGKQLGLGAVEVAWGIRRIVNASMAGAVRAVSVGRGYDPRDFCLIAFGAAGPMHVADIAVEMEIPGALVPPVPGCHSALGQVVTDVVHDYIATRIAPVRPALEESLNDVFSGLELTATRELVEEGIEPANHDLVRTIDLRYAGQQFSMNVPVASTQPGWLLRTVASFHDLHERTYGFRAPEEPVELVNVRVRGVGRLHQDVDEGRGQIPRHGAAEPTAWRDVYFGSHEGDRLRTSIYQRLELLPGTTLIGPAIVEQNDSTIVIPPGVRANCDGFGNLLMTGSPARA